MRIFGWTGLLFFSAFVTSCSNNAVDPRPDRFDSGTLHISCDESFKPVMDAQIQVYQAQWPNAKIIPHYKPEADCIGDFLVDSIRLVVASRGVSERERKIIADSLKIGPENFTMAYDAVALIVHPQAADSAFTLQQIRDLIGGTSNKNLIPVFDGSRATGTVRFMLDSVLRGKPIGKNAVAAKDSRGVIDYVAQTPNAVGFLGIGWIGNADDSVQQSDMRRVQLARLESSDSAGYYVLPVQWMMYTGAYPLVRSLVYVLKENYDGLAHGFADFLRSDRGQLLFRRSYLFPAKRPFYERETELR